MGALAENLTLSGVHERTVCLGDIHHIGSVILRVSQPRKPCWKIAKRWNAKHFTEEIYTSGLSGWYYQVLQEGLVCKNDTIFLEEKGKGGISILEANRAFKDHQASQQCLKNILNIPLIAPSYLESIEKRLRGDFSLDYMAT
jgi:MOSC domain-containing protein YiiM